MIPSTATPILRPQVDHLLRAEDASRQVRRLIRRDDDGRTAEVAACAACTLIDEAIDQLIAARTIIAPGAGGVTS